MNGWSVLFWTLPIGAFLAGWLTARALEPEEPLALPVVEITPPAIQAPFHRVAAPEVASVDRTASPTPIATATPLPSWQLETVDGERRLYVDGLRSLLAEEAPATFRQELERIALCESGAYDRARGEWYVLPDAVGDGGDSLGFMQLWHGWAPAYGVPAEALYEPETALKVAIFVREYLGRFGGPGGWSCSDLLGIR